MTGKLFSANTLVIFLTLIGAFFHFFNLNWGAPWYFHPDERNIAMAVSQLHFPDQTNPHFFAYGSLPIYVIYLTGVIAHFFSHLQIAQVDWQVQFAEAIIISRAYSALFATALIPILFVLGKRLKDTRTGLIAATLTTFSVGLIQYAHFGTFELWLTFFSVCFLWTCLNLLNRIKVADLIATSVVFGILIATKVSSLVLGPLPLLVLLLRKSNKPTESLSKKRAMHLIGIFLQFAFFLLLSGIIYLLSNPYIFLDQQNFTSSIEYESSVGLGTLPVFYTSGFYDTIPVLYQFLHVYPFLLNPLITVLFLFAFVVLLRKTIHTKNKPYVFLFTLFFILFISQTFLFVKWTRYLVPTLPLIYLIIALAISDHWQKQLQKGLLIVTALVCILFSVAYFKTVFVDPDTRLAALSFAKTRIAPNATILSEPYDLGTFPMQTSLTKIETFNFYDFDSPSIDATPENLKAQLAKADYIIVPSQRILQPRIQQPNRFPNAHRYYQQLLNGQLGFQKIYETPCDIFCQITYLNDPIYHWEQTVNVFDRPIVYIFQKTVRD